MDDPQGLKGVGRAITNFRTTRNMTRQMFANLCGVSARTVEKIEQVEDFQPRLNTLMGLAQGLGISFVDLARLIEPEAAGQSEFQVSLAALPEPERNLLKALMPLLIKLARFD